MSNAFQQNAFQQSPAAFQDATVAPTFRTITDTTILQKPINAVLAGQQKDPKNIISKISPLIKYDK